MHSDISLGIFNKIEDVSKGIFKTMKYVKQLGYDTEYDGECLTVIFPEDTTRELEIETMDKIIEFIEENVTKDLEVAIDYSTDDLNERVVDKLWQRDRVRYDMLYDDFIIIKAYINLVTSINYDIRDEQLENTIRELGRYLHDMVKHRVDKYSKYTEDVECLPKLEKVRYEVLADDIIKLIQKNNDEDIKNEAIKQHMKDKVSSWGEDYYGWNEK